MTTKEILQQNNDITNHQRNIHVLLNGVLKTIKTKLLQLRKVSSMEVLNNYNLQPLPTPYMQCSYQA